MHIKLLLVRRALSWSHINRISGRWHGARGAPAQDSLQPFALGQLRQRTRLMVRTAAADTGRHRGERGRVEQPADDDIPCGESMSGSLRAHCQRAGSGQPAAVV